MLRKMAVILIAAMLLSSGLTARAQAPAAEDKIRQLREEIKKREAIDRDAPDDLKEMNRKALADRRVRLRDLLQAEVARYRAAEATLGAFATPEERQAIDEKIRVYELEIKSLNVDLRSTQAAAPPAPAAAEVAAVRSGAGGATGAAPASGPSTAGAAPAAGPSPQTQPAPSVEPVSESEEASGAGEKSPTEQRTCKEFEELKNKNPLAVSPLDDSICGMVRLIRGRKDSGQITSNIELTGPEFEQMLVVLIGKKDTPKFITEVQEARMDQQVEGAPSNSGATSLVTKGGTPAVLGFAVENGALTQSVTGTTVTFRGNPLGIIHTLHDTGLVTGYREDEKDPLTRFLRKTSFAFSFDTDRGPDPGVFTAKKQQLSALGARIEFINKRKPSLYAKEWEQFINDQAADFTQQLANSRAVLVDEAGGEDAWRDPVLQAWFAQTQQVLAAAQSSEVEEKLRERLSKLPIAELSPPTVAALNGFEKELGVYVGGRDQIIDKITRGTLVTFDYLNKREVSKPDTSTFTFIAEKGPGGRRDLTFNGTLTLYHSRPPLFGTTGPRIRRVRDFQFAGQLDLPFGNVRDVGQFDFWAGGRYERLLEDAATQAGTVVPNTKGDIAVLQLGLKIPIKGLGIRLPISISFANRTELIKEKEVRGNFGFTFNLDSILARFKPF